MPADGESDGARDSSSGSGRGGGGGGACLSLDPAWRGSHSLPQLRSAQVPPSVALLMTQAVAGAWHGTRAGQLLFFAHTVPLLLNAKALFRFQVGDGSG